MLVGATCVYIASHVDVRDGKTYASCNLENHDSVVQVPVSERALPALNGLKKYTAYDCTFEYDRVNTNKGNFTVFRLHDISPVSEDKK